MLAPSHQSPRTTAPLPAARAAVPAAVRGDHRRGVLEGSTAERLLIVVARVHGRFRPAVVGGVVDAGALLGHITGGGRSEEVRAPAALEVQGLLAHSGHLVAPGQALIWAHHVEAAA